MRSIQLIARVNQGGTARWLENLILGLRERGHDTYLLAGHVQNGESEDSIFLELNGIRVNRLGRRISIFSDFLAILEIRNKIREIKPEVLNTHTAKAGLLGRIAAIGMKIKVVHTFHGHLLYGYFSPFKTKIYILIERALALISDNLISVGMHVRNDLIKFKIGKKSKFKVIYPGIKVKEVNIEKKNSSFTIGWLGRLTKIKRPERVLEIANQLPHVEFLIGGDGDLFEETSGHSPANVKLVGWVDPAEFWPICDLGLLTSDNEGMPTALIEAGLFGIPVIAWDVGSVNEIVKDGQTGVLVSNLSEALEALSGLIHDLNKISQYSKNAKKFCQETFNLKRFIDDHLEAYS